MKIWRSAFAAFLAVAVVLCASYCPGAVVTFANNPSSNSSDWTNFVSGSGATVNSNVNFNSHGLGALNSNFYLGSDGVSLIPSSSAINQIVFGAGPADGNTFGSQPGEGLHSPSNFLRGSVGAKSLVINFDEAVIGGGLFTIDYFDSSPNDRMQLSAYSGLNGTGALIGTAISVNNNFQNNNLYFMGIASTDQDIMSLVFSYSGSSTGDTIGIDDIRFARVQQQDVVPEPSTLVIISTALLGIGFARFRGRRSSPLAS